jgi:hypothetical protein
VSGALLRDFFAMGGTNAQLPTGRQVSLPGHFDLPVTGEKEERKKGQKQLI